MTILNAYVPYYPLLLSICHSFQCRPYTLNKVSSKITPYPPAIRCCTVTQPLISELLKDNQFWIHFLYIVLSFMKFVSMLQNPGDKLDSVVVAFQWVVIQTAVFSCRVSFRLTKWDTANLHNSMVDFENRFVKAHKKDKIGLLMLILMTTSAFVLPVVGILVQIAFPCLPPLLGSILLNCGSGYQLPTFMITLMTFVIPIHSWALFGTPEGILTPVINYGLPLRCIFLYLKPTNVFQLPGSFQNPQKLEGELKKYRCVQLLNNQFNQIHQHLLTLLVILFTALINIPSLIIFLKLRHFISPVFKCLLGASLLTSCPVPLLIYAFAGQIFRQSKKQKGSWVRNSRGFKTERKHSRYLHKCSVSLQPIKIRIGSVNFFDESTVFVNLDMWSRTAISLMLMME